MLCSESEQVNASAYTTVLEQGHVDRSQNVRLSMLTIGFLEHESSVVHND